MATLNLNVYAAHTPVSLGMLRNGTAASVVASARQSSIAPKYFFRGVRHATALDGDAAAFSPACPVVVLLEAQVRCAFSVLVEAAVVDARRAHAASGSSVAFGEDAARTTAVGDANIRLEAIALGGTHTANVCSYNVTEADFVATESGPAKLKLTPPTAYADAVALAAAERTPNAGWQVALASGSTSAAATKEERVMLNMTPLTAVEAEFAFMCMTLGQAAPVRAGAQLFVDEHHYLSDADSSSRHRATEREVVGKASTEVRNVWRAATPVLRNAIWHAGIHFIQASVLKGFAEDPGMPERLNATQIGSMSVGLPAQEDLFNRAGSFVAVFNQVYQTATAHNHELSLTELTETVAALKDIGRGAALPAQRPALPGLPAGAWPAGCDSRAKALRLYLEPALDKAEPVAAWMFGFYREICSRAGIRANSQEGSLLRSYSLKRAVTNFLGEANRAQEMYAARSRWLRTEAEKGNLEAYKGSA